MVMVLVFAYIPMGGIVLAWKKYIATKGDLRFALAGLAEFREYVFPAHVLARVLEYL